LGSSVAVSSRAFLDQVLSLKPRTAVFDCDGTIWVGDSGMDFMYWTIEEGIVPKDRADWILARYEDYKRKTVSEEDMCGEMVQIYAGIREQDMEQHAATFFESKVSHRIFSEMQELTLSLKDSGCELWAVSSTNVWVVREGVKRFGIAPDKVLAAYVGVKNGVLDDVVDVPTGPTKATFLQRAGLPNPDAVFGNSVHDQAMLEIARQPFAVNPNPDLETVAAQRQWQVYFPAGTR